MGRASPSFFLFKLKILHYQKNEKIFKLNIVNNGVVSLTLKKNLIHLACISRIKYVSKIRK